MADQLPSRSNTDADWIARAFHDRYEEIAPHFGYKTRKASAVPWERVPEANRDLMRATVQWLLDVDVIRVGDKT